MRTPLKWLGDPAVAATAEAVAQNLRALGLHVEAKRYGPHFVEIVASTSPKLITTPHNAEASGIALLLAWKYDPPTLVFEEINSLSPGLGRAMVEAALQGVAGPESCIRKVRVDDASPHGADGLSFWRRAALAHAWLEWEITESERTQAQGRQMVPAPLQSSASTKLSVSNGSVRQARDIADNGEALRAELTQRLFDLFLRAKGRSALCKTRMGLGLALMRFLRRCKDEVT
ncbi:ATP-binding protein [Methylocystis bryophila]|uniref:Uncharacterized protein n=1 Tax=Methylocystis bryophila TaxID=655015 RepID=A0A1W6MZE9_9HYPH|nr:ATP-binding protein [Methylocystis bryophila]ARN82919.1 hypothetical protein B1812_19625 [Methylocystis bryophila]BDV39202.1 hypothetical protein DSM21852_24550 [Methylocystis bryophila]